MRGRLLSPGLGRGASPCVLVRRAALLSVSIVAVACSAGGAAEQSEGDVPAAAEQPATDPVLEAPTPSPVAEPEPPQEPALRVLLHTVAEGATNTIFNWSPWNQLAQSILVNDPVEVHAVRIRAMDLYTIPPGWWDLPLDERGKQLGWTDRAAGIRGVVTVEIYRSIGDEELGSPVDIVTQLELLGSTTTEMTFDVGSDVPPAELVLDQPLTLPAGRYLVAIRLSLDDGDIYAINLAGRQSGDNTVGGPAQDRPTDCVYEPSEDLYPEGRAYLRGSPQFQTPPGTPIEFEATFHLDQAKVEECVVLGQYDAPFNQGDLDLALVGREADR
jgi:hypothetical protein